VTVVGALAGPWQPGEYGWWSYLDIQYVRQDDLIVKWPWRIAVAATGEGRPVEGRVRCRGFIRRAPALANGVVARAPPWRLTVKSPRFVTGGRPESVLSADVARRGVEARIDALADRPSRQLLRALLLGRSQDLDREVLQDLRRSGLSHLFAVSGLHVALIAGIGLGLSWPLPPRARGCIAGLWVVGYVLLVGPRPAVLRAASMAAFTALGLASGRPASGLQALAACVRLLVLASPELILDLGFCLTVSATLGILVLGPALAARWTAMPGLLRGPLAASVGAQLASAPWVWSSFSLLTPVSPLLNLVAVPWVSVTLALSCVWALLAGARPAMAVALEPLVATAAQALSVLTRLGPSPALTWPLETGFLAAAAAAAGVAGALLARHGGRRIGCAALAILILGGAGDRGVPELAMIDVGQGDAFLVRDGGRAMLVDGGGWPRADIAGRVLLPVLAARGIRRLAGAVVTHGDVDHCRGILDLARYIDVGLIRLAPGAGGRCVEEIRTGGRVAWTTVAAGDRWDLGRWTFTVLHPSREGTAAGNDGSLVLSISGFGRRALLTGDIGASAEREVLVAAGREALKSDLLKLAHHGSSSSTSQSFLRAVDPSLALVSAGRGNRYGHPSPAVLRRVRAHGARVLRTDREGMVSLVVRRSGALRLETFGP
jgi:competence protein ComEC